MTYFLHTTWVALLIYSGVCAVYYFIQENFIFVPTLPGEPFEPKLHTSHEELYIETPHGGRIHGLLLKVKESKGLIFYLHGNTGSLKRWQFMAEELAGYGWDVFVMDYRGYGQSRGPRNEAFMHRDVEECFDRLSILYPNSQKIIYGRSLGSGFAVRLASRRKSDILILETPFSNFVDVARYYLPFLPMRILLRYKFRNDFFIQHLNCPVYIFHGTTDKMVPYKSALKLYNAAKKVTSAELFTIVGGRHSNLNSFPLFRDKMKEILA
ncbi:MAG: alpha/beta fold hydrolase [Flavobacteriales bacterium]|nr:alpha/beta fold hydrolase [Flavobacteriales bacterium]